MAIVGITVDKEGAPIIRQAVTHKLAIGMGPGQHGNYPKKLDYIAFMKKQPDGKWAPDQELTEHYKKQSEGKVTSLQIVLFDNDEEKCFPNSMKAYKARGCWCRGNGEVAERRDLGRDGKGWSQFQPYKGPCANGGCPLPANKECKAMGTLYFSLVDFLKLGSVCKIQTTSTQSVAQIYGALMTLKRMTGGVLMGIPIRLFMQPDRAVFMEGTTAKTGSKFVWGLEVAARDIQEMRRQLTDGPRAFYEIRQLAAGTVIEAEEENEADLAEEIVGEFDYENEEVSADKSAPADKGAGAANAGAREEKQSSHQAVVDESALEDRADALMTQMGMGNRAFRTAEIGRYRGRMKELVDTLEDRRRKSQKGPNEGDANGPGAGTQAANGATSERPVSQKEKVIERQKEKSRAQAQATPANEQQVTQAEPRKAAGVAAQQQSGFEF